jgi:hypothetical protein
MPHIHQPQSSQRVDELVTVNVLDHTALAFDKYSFARIIR